MILRKAAGPTLPAQSSSPPPQGSTLPNRYAQQSRTGVVIVLFMLSGFLFVVFQLSWATSGLGLALRTEPTASTSPPVSLDNCAVISQLLNGDIPSSNDGLPSAGKQTSFGAVFWLKTPVLKAKLPGSNVDVVLLKYNKYLPKQHTLKWSNTVSILNEFRESNVFPKMFAYCKDPGDGFHYILVEWIDLHPSEMTKPTLFEQCFDRGGKILDMLVSIDEDMHLAFMDVKKGQWMSRADQRSFVLQDVDDIVRSPWTPSKEAGDLYFDQVEHAQGFVQSYLPQQKSIGYVKKMWDEVFFPNGYTIRYTMILLQDILKGDMGFRWESDCRNGMPPNFMQCLYDLMKWTGTTSDNWPAPKQVRWGYNQCGKTGSFDVLDPNAKRPPAPWRDAPPKPSGQQYISCYRSRDVAKKTDTSYTENIALCYMNEDGQPVKATSQNSSLPMSCCRGKGVTPCYYAVSSSLCSKIRLP